MSKNPAGAIPAGVFGPRFTAGGIKVYATMTDAIFDIFGRAWAAGTDLDTDDLRQIRFLMREINDRMARGDKVGAEQAAEEIKKITDAGDL